MKPSLKILLINDNKTETKNLITNLDENELNFQVSEILSTQTAISTLKNNHFDAILLNYPLAEEDAVALIKKISMLKSSIPIIVLSHQNDEKIAVEIMKAGAYDYLSKSRVTPEVIERALCQGIRFYQAEAAVQQANRRLRKRNQLLRKKNRELQKQRQKIKLQNLQLKQAYQLKSQFLSTLSHELRTPMNAIIGFSQILLRNYPDPLTSQQEDMVQRIYSNSQNLLTMINGVLDFSAIETGNIKFKGEEFNLANFIQVTVEEIRSLAVQKNLTLDIDLYFENPMVKSDRFCYRSIFLNLLSNALKFTAEGGVLIKGRELDDDRLAISIQDTGKGIEPESLSTIFEPFRQVDQSTSRQYNGTGLGLAIVDSLVKMMGGKIMVESKPNQGSIFQVEIPRIVEI